MRRTLIFVCALGLALAAAPAFRAMAPGEVLSRGSVPEFYAQEIVDQANVADAENALGEPDGRYAQIRPGGDMTVRLSEPIRSTDGSDDGRVVAKDDARYGLAGLFTMTEEGEMAWQSLVAGGTAAGFKLSSSVFPVAQSTEMIRIVNDDDRPVYVDAIIGFRAGRSTR